MMELKKLKTVKNPVIGLYTVGLKAYWAQFEGMKERLAAYGKFIEERLSLEGEVKNFGFVDSEYEAQKAGEWFNSQNVDLVFCHLGTYVTSACVIPVHQICKAKAVVLNLQPTAQINYEKTTTGEWLANCSPCVAPEISNAFNRSGIEFNCINGLLGMEKSYPNSFADENTASRPEAIRAWKEINEYVRAAKVVKNLRGARFGFLGNTYSGMLDMYSDFTMIAAQAGIHIEVLEMCDLNEELQSVTEVEIEEKLEEIENWFEISGDSPSDPRVKKPTKEQLGWSAIVAAAQEKLVKKLDLDALAYYYHSTDENPYEELQSGFIVGHSLLTAKGIPCSGEGDLKTALAMKVCDILDCGGSFCEIVVTDYVNGTILIGHDGPFHIKISDRKPILRGLGVYHGKKGSGVSVEAKVRLGDITTLGVTQTGDGKLKFIISEAESVEGKIMTIGNTQTPAKFSCDPDSYMDRWFAEAPTHHCALSVGKNVSVLKKVGKLLDIKTVEV